MSRLSDRVARLASPGLDRDLSGLGIFCTPQEKRGVCPLKSERALDTRSGLVFPWLNPRPARIFDIVIDQVKYGVC